MSKLFFSLELQERGPEKLRLFLSSDDERQKILLKQDDHYGNPNEVTRSPYYLSMLDYANMLFLHWEGLPAPDKNIKYTVNAMGRVSKYRFGISNLGAKGLNVEIWDTALDDEADVIVYEKSVTSIEEGEREIVSTLLGWIDNLYKKHNSSISSSRKPFTPPNYRLQNPPKFVEKTGPFFEKLLIYRDANEHVFRLVLKTADEKFESEVGRSFSYIPNYPKRKAHYWDEEYLPNDFPASQVFENLKNRLAEYRSYIPCLPPLDPNPRNVVKIRWQDREWIGHVGSCGKYNALIKFNNSKRVWSVLIMDVDASYYRNEDVLNRAYQGDGFATQEEAKSWVNEVLSNIFLCIEEGRALPSNKD